jgi:hypothetical protein
MTTINISKEIEGITTNPKSITSITNITRTYFYQHLTHRFHILFWEKFTLLKVTKEEGQDLNCPTFANENILTKKTSRWRHCSFLQHT